MPHNKLQEFIFTVMMVLAMVYGMVVYNIAIDRGGLTNEVFLLAFGELWLMGPIGFVLEMFATGPIAKRLAFRIVTPGKDRPSVVIAVISVMTVCVMCPCMSLVATVIFKGMDAQIVAKWLQTTAINFPMALCWQLFAAGPLVRKLFALMFRRERKE